MHYTFRYSTFVKVITFIGLWALALILYLLLTVDGLSSFAFVLWAGALGLIYPPLSMPRSIEDDGETVVLRRLLWSKRYSRMTYDISEISGINLMNGLRVFGSGGYFGYSGLLLQDEDWPLQAPRYGGHRPLPTHPAQG